MPVKDAELYVNAAITSILTQDFVDLELIIIDDGSDDNSAEVINSVIRGDSRCRFISRENRGLVDTANELISLARGQYIFRMDADDFALPSRVSKQIGYLHSNADCVCVGSKVLLADHELRPIAEACLLTEHQDIDAENMRGGWAICHPASVVRRDALIRIGGYRKEAEWAEDLDLFLRLAEIGRLSNLPEVLLTYRQHLRSAGYSRRELQVDAASFAVHSAKHRRGNLAAENDWASAANNSSVTGYSSVADIHRKWAWQALMGGNVNTARLHGFQAMRLRPFHRDNLKLIPCLVRGY